MAKRSLILRLLRWLIRPMCLCLPQRLVFVLLCLFSNIICYADRTNIGIAVLHFGLSDSHKGGQLQGFALVLPDVCPLQAMSCLHSFGDTCSPKRQEAGLHLSTEASGCCCWV